MFVVGGMPLQLEKALVDDPSRVETATIGGGPRRGGGRFSATHVRDRYCSVMDDAGRLNGPAT